MKISTALVMDDLEVIQCALENYIDRDAFDTKHEGEYPGRTGQQMESTAWAIERIMDRMLNHYMYHYKGTYNP
jgi:hypothetical protein